MHFQAQDSFSKHVISSVIYQIEKLINELFQINAWLRNKKTRFVEETSFEFQIVFLFIF